MIQYKIVQMCLWYWTCRWAFIVINHYSCYICSDDKYINFIGCRNRSAQNNFQKCRCTFSSNCFEYLLCYFVQVAQQQKTTKVLHLGHKTATCRYSDVNNSRIVQLTCSDYFSLARGGYCSWVRHNILMLYWYYKSHWDFWRMYSSNIVSN